MKWTREDVLRSLYAEQDLFQSEPGTTIWTDFDVHLIELHRFTERVRKAHQFEIDHLRRKLAMGHVEDSRITRFGDLAWDPTHAVLRYSEQTEAFLRCFRRSHVPVGRWHPNEVVAGGKTAAEAFADFLADLRSESRRPEVTRAIARRRAQATRNSLSATDVVKRLTKRPKGLHVARVMLAYASSAPLLDARQAVRDLQSLLNNARHWRCLKATRGYLWKVEFGQRDGFRIQLVLFSNAASIKTDPLLCVAEIWRNVTQGRGVARNTLHQESLISATRLYSGGTGPWNGQSRAKRAELIRGIQYAMLKDEFVRPRNPSVSVFNHSEVGATARQSKPKKAKNPPLAPLLFPKTLIRKPLPELPES